MMADLAVIAIVVRLILGVAGRAADERYATPGPGVDPPDSPAS
jgi:hypothetical protein